MTQNEINETEWKNPDNWSAGLYFCKRDSRVWVPKQVRSLGWTLNLGQRKGAMALVATIVGSILLAVLANVVVVNWVVHR